MPVNYQQAGLSALTLDPENCGPGAALTPGTVYLNRVSFEEGAALLPANIFAGITGAATGASTGSFMGVYNCATLSSGALTGVGGIGPVAAGTRLAVTADLGLGVANSWTPVPLTWVAGFGEMISGDYWLAIVSNHATTELIVAQGNSAVAQAALPNLNLPAAGMRYATNATGQTSLPATIVVASNVSTNARPLLMGLSL